MHLRASALILICAAVRLAQADIEAVVTTEQGSFRLEFAPDAAPKHVAQFIARVREGYYNGSAFHRVVANGMIQGGDPLLKNPKTAKNLWGSGGLNLLASEFGMKHERGTVSTVSLPNKPDSDGAQFFVCVVAQPSLDGHYSAFGRVTEGMDVVEKISRVPADKLGIVDQPVRILTVTIEPKKVEPFLTATPAQLRRTVTLRTTLGTLKIRTEPDWAPENARAFLKLAASGWYNGTTFHRIVKGFAAQGGTANERATGATHAADRWVRPIKGEFQSGVKHDRGIVSMARADDPDSALTSFFLVLGPSPHLDGQYSAFGRVVEGLEVLDAMEKEEVDGETPKRRIELIEATVDPE
jgi:cyclophilin family peptidyl-prolyl cis-trans isomerase